MNWRWDFALEIAPELIGALGVTVLATILGFVLAMVLGLAWAILGRSKQTWVAIPVRWTVEFVRSTPLLVQIYFLFFVLPDFGLRLSPIVTGVLALGLHYSAYTSEVYRGAIAGVPRGQWEAALALNLGRGRMWRAVILPEAIPPAIPALGNYGIAMFKDTPLLAAISITEVLQEARLIGSETFRYLEPLTLVGLLFLILSLVASRLVHQLEVRYGRAA
jgi:polar amino acid transport system permease protein